MILERILQYVVNPLIYLLIGIAVVVFLWGVVEFIIKSDDPSGRIEGQKHLLWGIVGLAIAFGVFGILNVIQNTLLGLLS